MEVINQIHQGRLLAGLPLVVDSITVYSPKLIQIANIGYPIYNINLGVCINDGLPPHCMEYENKFDNVLQYDGEYLTYFLWGLEFFTSKTFVKQNECFIVEDESLRLDRNNFDGLVYLLKLANCVDPEKDRVKGMRNKDLDEKIAKAKRELNERLGRSPDDNKIELIDLISVLASKHNNLNIMNIWDLNYFQFNNQFNRMQLVENYDLGIRQLLAGADKDKVKLEHYIKKIK